MRLVYHRKVTSTATWIIYTKVADNVRCPQSPAVWSLLPTAHWEGLSASPGLLPFQHPPSYCSPGWHHHFHNVYWSFEGLLFPLSPPLLSSLSTSLNFQLQTSFQKPLVDKSQGFINVCTVPSQVTLGEEVCQTGYLCQSRLAVGEVGHKYLTQWGMVWGVWWGEKRGEREKREQGKRL